MLTATHFRAARADGNRAASGQVARVRTTARPPFPARRRLRSIVALTALVAACRPTGASGPSVVLHGQRGAAIVRVELALTSDQRTRGLMWRSRLDSDAGMLFVFPEMRMLAFWMKNTPLPLDIIYIDAEGRVVSVAESTTPYSEKSLPSAGPAQYVLEVNAGFAKEHGIGPGTRVELPADIQTRAAASDSGS